MKKYLGMLEQKVEWIALAVGVGFMGYMAWLYVIHTPIQAQIGGSDVKVGDIDTQIVERVVTPLETAMNTQSVGAVAKPPGFVDGFHKAMSYADAATTQPSAGD